MPKTVSDITQLCKEHDIKMIDFKMIDIDGRWRHITIPSQNFTQDTVKYGIGFDGSNYGYRAVEKSDMVFIPDISSAHIDPFAQVPTLSMLGDVCVIEMPDNKPFDQYPKNVAKATVEYMKTTGIADKFIIGPEFEFHIFDNVRYSLLPQKMSLEIDCRQAGWNSQNADNNNSFLVTPKSGYHCDLPHDVNAQLRSEICMLMDSFGVPVKYHHHEVGGSGQQEIEVELGEMTAMADATMIVKYLVRNCCAKYSKTATFMPKPIYKEAGNGMHVHMLLTKEGKPLFYDEKGYSQLSQTAMYFMGGLLRHAPSLCAFTNPSTNSYKRLVPGFEAPVTIGYATANRSAVIRIPAYAKSPMHKRFELRNPDATCNPYYAYSAILMAGLDGIKNKIDASQHGWGPFDYNLYNLSDQEKAKIFHLPTSVEQSVEALLNDCDYLKQGGVFSETLIKLWAERKLKEAVGISQIPNPAEFLNYFDL